MKILDAFWDLLFPPRCAFCHKLTHDGARICKNCERSLPYTEGTAQVQHFPHLDRCVAPLYYENDVRASLHRYKFASATGYASIYGEFLSKCIDENEISCDIITWVPLSRKRLHKRGYDQARLLAEEIARHSALPCVRLLKKVRDNPAQSKTGNAAKRKANVAGAYQAIAPEQIRGKHILVVDDIVTTGSTLSECARMLRLAGAKTVSAAAVARHRP